MTEGHSVEFELLRECTMLARRWRAFYDARIKRFGLTAAKASVLYWLADAGRSMKQVELADLLQVEGPTLVRLLNALEADGFVQRRTLEEDARAKAVSLTPKGVSLVELIASENIRLSEEALQSMRAIKVQKAVVLIKEARKALAEAEREASRDARASDHPAERSARY